MSQDPGYSVLIFSIQELRKQVKILEQQEEELLSKLKEAFGDQEELIEGGNVLATYKPTKVFDERTFMEKDPSLAERYTKTSIDVTLLKKENPLAYFHFCKESPTKRLVISKQ